MGNCDKLIVAGNRKYTQIYQRIWGKYPYGKVNDTISCHILNIRKKFARKSQTLSFAISLYYNVL